MRLVLLAMIVSACGGEPTCTGGLYCSASQRGDSCQQDDVRCTCNGASWTCTDCPDGELPSSTCDVAGSRCSVSGFENACDCTCAANGEWSCVVGDPDPHFHCSF